MGTGGKLHLKFKKRFWPENSVYTLFLILIHWTGFHLLERKILIAILFLWLSQQMKWLRKWIVWLTKKKWICLKTSFSEYFNVIWKEVSKTLNGFTGAVYRRIVFISISNSKVSDRSILAESIDDKLFFAGEATEPIHFATMHGAVNSGYRAANEALSKF